MKENSQGIQKAMTKIDAISSKVSSDLVEIHNNTEEIIELIQHVLQQQKANKDKALLLNDELNQFKT